CDGEKPHMRAHVKTSSSQPNQYQLATLLPPRGQTTRGKSPSPLAVNPIVWSKEGGRDPPLASTGMAAGKSSRAQTAHSRAPNALGVLEFRGELDGNLGDETPRPSATAAELLPDP